MKNFLKQGHTINYLNSSGETIASGSVIIIGKLAGVAQTDILDGEVGAVLLEGVFTLKKAGTFAITQGDQLFWNATTGITKTVTDSLLGIAFDDALSASLSANVKLLPGGDGAPVAALVAALTDNTGGTASGTLALVATGTPASLAAQGTINGVLGDALASISAKQNAIIAALKAAGLMATS